ncbi:membrane protein-related [Anaeramoeba flamelloides]|uniref:Membrane protein-related n=1 Tax=Anaeramoeba flamelloides TaxID=1746091 RepID=A0AAV7ZX03_9EUKA|nr:membrane protein-related [Anaeramoeba flamelloides]KAJ6230121.1 membrane protein-related [Anaeramoeba flamelloides]
MPLSKNTKFFVLLPFIFFIPNIILPIYYNSKLPSKVAIHYNGDGDADNWGSKSTLIGINVALSIFSLVMFLLTCLCVLKCPSSMLNIPNREYWGSSVMRPILMEKITPFLSLTFTFVEIIDFFMFFIVFRSNVHDSKKLEGFWVFYVLLTLFVVSIISLSFRVRKSFSKTHADPLIDKGEW